MYIYTTNKKYVIDLLAAQVCL